MKQNGVRFLQRPFSEFDPQAAGAVQQQDPAGAVLQEAVHLQGPRAQTNLPADPRVPGTIRPGEAALSQHLAAEARPSQAQGE